VKLLGKRMSVPRSAELRSNLLASVKRQVKTPLIVSKEIRRKARYYNQLFVLIRRRYVGYKTKPYRSDSPEFQVFVKLALKFHDMEEESGAKINVPVFMRQHFEHWGRACYPARLLGQLSHFFYKQFDVAVSSPTLRRSAKERVRHERSLLVELSLKWKKSPIDMFTAMTPVFPYLESMSGKKRQTVLRRATSQVAQITRRESRSHSHKQVRQASIL